MCPSTVARLLVVPLARTLQTQCPIPKAGNKFGPYPPLARQTGDELPGWICSRRSGAVRWPGICTIGVRLDLEAQRSLCHIQIMPSLEIGTKL